ncbi:MAG TPA: hypothetical protein VKQ27_04980 [Acetobacteraceae bacterium]|nr:hypothetical protein [Acetobacteraceae bacterium]
MDNKSEVVFITDLEVSGFLNGVINMAFSTTQYVPEFRPAERDGETFMELAVSPAPVITANLRFDLRVAQQIRDRLNQIIADNTKPKVTN